MGYKYEIYTDGSCKKNGTKGAVGGWAFIIRQYDENNKCIGEWTKADWEDNTTNNRMELTAIIHAVRGCGNIMYGERREGSVTVYSDSAYIINCYSQGWYHKWEKNGWINSKKKPVENRDLWEELIHWFKDENIHFKKITGHAGEEYNELVDFLAQNSAANKIRSINYEGMEEESWS